MENEKLRDEFIRKLMSRQPVDKAPEGFTARVMEKLQPETVPSHEHILSPLAWGAIFTGIAAVIITMILVDIPFITNFFSTTGIQQISLDIFNGKFYESFIRFFKEFNINAIGIAIVIGFISLVVLERIIAKKRQTQQMLLL
jgi:ABC-type spermidine/putrescine transport system permease subunit II